MDPYALGGMIFSVVMVLIIGGFIITFPLLKRLGGLMEESIRERRDARLEKGQVEQISGDIAELRSAFESIERQLELVGERQEFVENLLSHRTHTALPDPDRGEAE
jgi:divalent metal cation (Fe/Co/Zn/Cd) transporter